VLLPLAESSTGVTVGAGTTCAFSTTGDALGYSIDLTRHIDDIYSPRGLRQLVGIGSDVCGSCGTECGKLYGIYSP
jgi:hypothetical protein